MTDDSWVKLYRKIENWRWYTTPHMYHLFSHLFRNANHEPYYWKDFLVERGQLIIGRKTLSETTGIPEQTIRTCLTRLKSTNEITIKSTNKFSIITICNYDKYQGANIIVNQQINQESNQQLTNNQPTTNQQLTTIKNDKNDNKKKKNKNYYTHALGKKQNVLVTEEEYQELLSQWGEKRLNYWANQLSPIAGKYKSHALTMENWEKRKLEEGLEWDEAKGHYVQPQPQSRHTTNKSFDWQDAAADNSRKNKELLKTITTGGNNGTI